MAMGRRRWIAAAIGASLLVASACKKKPAGPSCDEQVNALGTWIQTLSSEGESVPKGTLAVLDEPSRPGIDAPDLELDSGRVKLSVTSSASTSDPASLVNELTSWRKSVGDVWRQLHPGQPAKEDFAARLSIRPSTRWSDVVTLMDALGKAGFTRVGFVFIGKSAASRPADTNVSRWFEENPRGFDDMSWSKPLSVPGRAFMKCPELIVPIGGSAGDSIDSQQRNRMLADVPPTLRECDCKMDVEAVKAAIWAEYRRYEKVPTLTHTVLIGTRGTAGAIDVRAGAAETWDKMAARVASAADKHSPIVFAVATAP